MKKPTKLRLLRECEDAERILEGVTVDLPIANRFKTLPQPQYEQMYEELLFCRWHLARLRDCLNNQPD